jgi:hypothetical protein
LDAAVHMVAIDAGSGDMFLWYDTELVRIDANTRRTRMRVQRGTGIYAMFADGGLLLLDHHILNGTFVSIYDTKTMRLLHRFESRTLTVRLEADKKRIYTIDSGLETQLLITDLDGHVVGSRHVIAKDCGWTWARLTNDRLVSVSFLENPHRHTVRWIDHTFS